MRKSISELLYLSMDPEESMSIGKEIPKRNLRSLRLYAAVASCLFAILLAASLAGHGTIRHNIILYSSMLCISAGLFLAADRLFANRPEAAWPLTWICMLSLYGFAGALAVIQKSLPSVSAIAVLMLMPQLFILPPVRMAAVTALAALVYIVMTVAFKSPEIVRVDCFNLIIFGLAAVASSVYQTRMKYQQLQEARRNRLLSETDLLTGTRNRNAYQQERPKLSAHCRDNVICIFADANGLHELNNTRGHEAGDRFLIAMAGALTEAFGAAHTYRVGGDEFVSFKLDGTMENVAQSVRHILETLEGQGYYISIGTAIQPKARLDPGALVHEAEQAMYREKSAFYNKAEHDRRKSR